MEYDLENEISHIKITLMNVYYIKKKKKKKFNFVK